MEELQLAVKRGKIKAPRCDGICHDFFQLSWETTKDGLLHVMNQMFMQGTILQTQDHGNTICLPKTHRPLHPEQYKPLNLLKANYKFLYRIIANRLRSLINEFLHTAQHCGVQNNNILGAISAIRETIAKAELTNAPTYTSSLDVKEAFGNTALSYLFAILESYGFSKCFQQRL